MKIKETAKFFDVRFSKPGVWRHTNSAGITTEHNRTTNYHAMVAAEDVIAVAKLVLGEHPTATIHQINHRGGDCAILVDVALLA